MHFFSLLVQSRVITLGLNFIMGDDDSVNCWVDSWLNICVDACVNGSKDYCVSVDGFFRLLFEQLKIKVSISINNSFL